MAKCEVCKREMLTACGCVNGRIQANGKLYPRIKMGMPGDFYFGAEPQERCSDCGAKNGYPHHWGCDAERCPSCGDQLIICDCENVALTMK